MTLHRFITDHEIHKGAIVVTDSQIVHQIATVLKIKSGEKIALCSGRGLQGIGTVKNIAKSAITIDIENIEKKISDTPREVNLYISILKRENMELVVQKATEVGISMIVPIITERTVKTGFNMERLRKIAKEASEQSGRFFEPKISDTMSLVQALTESHGSKHFFHGSGEVITSKSKAVERANIFIGPEGGWTDKECDVARDSGASIIKLSGLTMRAETAAIIASYIVINQ